MHLLLLLVLMVTCSLATQEYFKAAVVEYAPAENPDMDAEENILINVQNYVDFINNASSQKADIIVFPEIGLTGYGNEPFYSIMPHPSKAIVPCADNASYSKALTQLSCAARSSQIYVVVNMPELAYNTTNNASLHYNTNVVFDRNGTVVARYRKFNLFGEFNTSVPELEYVHFDTDFGVTFGVFICFDMVFKDPPLVLARDMGVRHFVFSTAWFSELPFLTALQAQWSFSYTLDVVLLASGYNSPAVGSSGSGIYQGTNGPYDYILSESNGNRMLVTDVMKKVTALNISSKNPVSSNTCLDDGGCDMSEGISLNGDNRRSEIENIRKGKETEDTFGKSLIGKETTTKLNMKQDAINMYQSQLLFPPETCEEANCVEGNSTIYLTYTTYTELCDNNFCCNFNISMTTIYEKTTPTVAPRGDDYNQLYYRLAVFNGVRSYTGLVTGGLQVCSVVPCIKDDVESCGIRSDDLQAVPRKIDQTNGTLYQTSTTFNHIEIHANFDYDSAGNTFVYPDILVSGTNGEFGSLLPSEAFSYQEVEPFNGTAHYELITLQSVRNLVTFGLYGRIFDRDGQPATDIVDSSSVLTSSLTLLVTCLVLIFQYSAIL